MLYQTLLYDRYALAELAPLMSSADITESAADLARLKTRLSEIEIEIVRDLQNERTIGRYTSVLAELMCFSCMPNFI